MTPDLRSLFDFPDPIDGATPIELRALTHGMPPKAVKRNLELFAEEWRVSGVDAWNKLLVSNDVFLVGDESGRERVRDVGWWNLPEVIGDRFISRLLCAPSASCIMMTNASQIVYGIISSVELQHPKRRKVICTDGEFPSVLHTLHNFNRLFKNYSLATKHDVQFDLRVISYAERNFSPGDITEQIDSATAIVFLSHVGFVRGEKIPVDQIREICDAAHRNGALVALDGYHALGSEPINVTELGVDLYFGGLLKEGCGSSGACFLYVRPGLELTPAISGWFGDQDPFGFKPEPQPSNTVCRRFLLGTTPIAPLYHGIEGAKILLRAGLPLVGQIVLDHVERVTSTLAEAGIKIVSPQERSRMSALIVLAIEHANKFREFLAREHRVYVDARKDKYIRFAPHIYNSAQEISLAIEAISTAYRTKSYLDYELGAKSGPVT